jgi:hypothetical protein
VLNGTAGRQVGYYHESMNGVAVMLAVMALLLYVLVRLQFFFAPRSKAVPGLSSSISSIVLTLPFRSAGQHGYLYRSSNWRRGIADLNHYDSKGDSVRREDRLVAALSIADREGFKRFRFGLAA